MDIASTTTSAPKSTCKYCLSDPTIHVLWAHHPIPDILASDGA